MSYLYLLLSSACSLLLVHLMKIGEKDRQRMLNTFTVNYLVAALFAFAAGGFPSLSFIEGVFHDPAVIFVLVTGAIFISNFLIYSKSIHLNGIGVSVAAMRLSLLIPICISIGFYDEQLTTLKGVGLLLVFFAMGIMIPKTRNIRFKKIDAAWLLIVIFVLTGLADSSLKIYEEDVSMQLSELQFMGLVFSCAFLIGLGLILARREQGINRYELGTGLLIGIPNLYSSVFLIYALQGMDGAIAYPVVNIVNVVGGAFLGLWVWNDNVTRLQWMGIGTAVIAIILLL